MLRGSLRVLSTARAREGRRWTSKLDDAKPSVNAETMLGDYRTPNFCLQPRMSVAEPSQVDIDAITTGALQAMMSTRGMTGIERSRI